MRKERHIFLRLAAVLIAVIFSLLCFAPATFAAQGDTISLSAWDRSESLNFTVQNMVPGDAETKEYAIIVRDDESQYLIMGASLHDPSAKLGEVLRIKVERGGNVIYDGLLKDLEKASVTLAGTYPMTIYFKVTVYLETSVGNEYMGQTLTADFHWSIQRKTDYPYYPNTEATTTAETTVETTTIETTTESSPVETTPEETTTAETTTETTTEYIPAETTTTAVETTTSITPIPIPGEPCCGCCIGYFFPYSCNFGSLGQEDIGCDLPWCCASDHGCWCPWCWIIPLIILIILIIVVIIIIRKLTKKEEEKEEEEEEEEEEEKKEAEEVTADE